LDGPFIEGKMNTGSGGQLRRVHHAQSVLRIKQEEAVMLDESASALGQIKVEI
jgi:ABC-type glutathione transport system ATPase component